MDKRTYKFIFSRMKKIAKLNYEIRNKLAEAACNQDGID